MKRIFDERLNGYSWTSIAEGLTADGIPAPRGGIWKVGTVRSIVHNEVYTGVAQYKRRSYRRGGKTGAAVRHEDAHDEIVSRATWNAAQSATTVQRTGLNVAGITGKLALCPSCGGRLSVTGSGKYLSYGCRRQRNGGKCPDPVFITIRIVDDVVEDAVRGALRGRIGTSPKTKLAELYAAEAEAREELEQFYEVASARDRRAFEKGETIRQASLDTATAARQQEEDRIGLATALPSAEAFERLSLDGRRRVASDLIREVRVAPASGGAPKDRITIIWR